MRAVGSGNTNYSTSVITQDAQKIPSIVKEISAEDRADSTNKDSFFDSNTAAADNNSKSGGSRPSKDNVEVPVKIEEMIDSEEGFSSTDSEDGDNEDDYE